MSDITKNLLSEATAKIEQIKKTTEDNLKEIIKLEALILQIQNQQQGNAPELFIAAKPLTNDSSQSTLDLTMTIASPTQKVSEKIDENETFSEGYYLEGDASSKPKLADTSYIKPTKKAWIK